MHDPLPDSTSTSPALSKLREEVNELSVKVAKHDKDLTQIYARLISISEMIEDAQQH